MKKQICTLLLCGCLLCSAGCSDGEQASSAVDVLVDANSQTMPDDVKSKLLAVLDTEPVQHAAENWTQEAVKSVIYINGQPMKDTVTLKDLGDGLKIREDDTLDIRGEKSNGFLTYYGVKFASCIVDHADSVNEMYERPLEYLAFHIDDDNDMDSTIYPIAINGVTIGTTFDETETRLTFMNKTENFDSENGSGHYEYESNDISISIYLYEEHVRRIQLKW